MNDTSKGFFYAIIAQFFVLGYFIFSKISYNYYNVLTTIVLWFGFSAVFSTAMILLSKKRKKYHTLKKFYRPLIVSNLFNVVSVFTSFFTLNLIGPSLVGFLGKMSIIFIILAGVIFLKEKFNVLEGISAILMIAGVITLSFSKGENIVLGVALMTISAACVASTHFIVKSRLGSLDPLLVVNVRAISIAIVALVISVVSGKLQITTTEGLIFATVPSIFSVIFYHLFIFKAYQKIDLSKAGLVEAMQPFLVVIAAFIVFGEMISPVQMLAGAVIVAGLVGLVISRRRAGIKRRKVVL